MTQASLRYDITLRTKDGVMVDILRNEASRPSSSYFVLLSEVPALLRRMRQIGRDAFSRDVLVMLVREGYVRQWH